MSPERQRGVALARRAALAYAGRGTPSPALAGVPFGDLRADLVGIFSAVYGKARAEQIFAGLEDLIRKRAEEGATTAVDKNHLKPLLIGALAAGGGGFLLALVALLRTRR